MHIPLAIAGLAWAIVAYVLFLIVSGLFRSRRNAAKAREWNCQKPVVRPNALPFGIDQIRRSLKADADHMFPVHAFKHFTDLNATTFSHTILGRSVYSTIDEQNIQAILAKQFKDFEIGSLRRGNFFPMLGNGIFTQNQHNGWDHSRAMMRPQFAREQVSDLDLEERHVQNMMLALSPTASGWTNEIDLQKLFFRLTLDSATEFLFGESCDSQLFALPSYKLNANSKSARGTTSTDSERFAYAFDKGQMFLAKRARFQQLYDLYNPSEFRKCCNDCHTFIDHFVRIALSKDLREKQLEAGAEKKYVFLEALAKETQDPVELRSQLLHILLAGRDTTASLLGWLFFSLARDPERFEKLRKVILKEFGSYESPKEITFSNLKSCVYLQQCLNESLRIYPVVPVNARTSTKDTTLPRGGGPDGKGKLFVPKGTMVQYSVYGMHHRKDIWGSDAEEFKPERWEGRRVGWEFLPFNGGPRICIGQQFALTEVSYVTVRLIQRVSGIENCDPELSAKHNLTLTNCSANGVKVKLRM